MRWLSRLDIRFCSPLASHSCGVGNWSTIGRPTGRGSIPADRLYTIFRVRCSNLDECVHSGELPSITCLFPVKRTQNTSSRFTGSSITNSLYSAACHPCDVVRSRWKALTRSPPFATLSYRRQAHATEASTALIPCTFTGLNLPESGL